MSAHPAPKRHGIYASIRPVNARRFEVLVACWFKGELLSTEIVVATSPEAGAECRDHLTAAWSIKQADGLPIIRESAGDAA